MALVDFAAFARASIPTCLADSIQPFKCKHIVGLITT